MRFFVPLILIVLIILSSANLYAQDILEKQENALKVIDEFATKLCTSDAVQTNGSAQKIELTGSAKTELKGIIKKVADLGIKGAAKYQTTKYEGLLQQDLANTITKRINCKLEVFNSLKDKLIPAYIPKRIQQNKLDKKESNTRKNFDTVQSNEKTSDIHVEMQTLKDLNSIRLALIPNVFFSKFDFTFEQHEVKLEHEIRNNGLNEVIIEAPIIQLSLSPFNESTPNTLLVVNRDYLARVVRPGKFMPSISYRVEYSIEILNPDLLGQTIYYSFIWKTQTDPSAISIMAPVLKKHMNTTEINELSKFNTTLKGSIKFAN